MKSEIIFIPISTTRFNQISEALMFLRKAYQEGNMGLVENMDEILDYLDTSNDIEYLEQKLNENHIDF